MHDLTQIADAFIAGFLNPKKGSSGDPVGRF
jgi:hypothetical protein